MAAFSRAWPRGRRTALWIIGLVIVAGIAVRAALPSVIKDNVNERLHALDGYDGRVADVDLALWRGAYRVEDIRIVKTGAQEATPFFSAERIDFSVEWRNLLRGALVAESVFWRPNLNLVHAENEREAQTGKGENWAAQLERLFPFRFNTVRVMDGSITFRAPGIRSEDAIHADKLDGAITNITNVVRSGEETFAGFAATAEVLDSGSAVLNGHVNPLAEQPTFDVDLTVKEVALPEVNPWLREYIKADAESGSFELYTELAAADGKFAGYAKPIMRDVDIYRSDEEEANPLKRLWEGIVDFAANVVEDGETGQVAARIPFSGSIENPDAGILETIASVLHNAFVSAFARSLEGSITLRDVKKNLREIGEEDPDSGS